MPVNSPIDLQLPQTPRLPPSENMAVYSEFQSVYNAIRNLWLALGSASFIDDAPSDGGIYGRQNGAWVIAGGGGGGGGVWGSITGDISDQTDLIAKFTTINNNITSINTDISDLWTALGLTNSTVANHSTRINALEVNDADQDVAIATKIGDAPSDGEQYARKNGGWSKVVGGGGTGSGIFMPMVAGDIPPTLLYSPEGELIYAQVED